MNKTHPEFRKSIGTGLRAFRKALLPIAVFEIVYRVAASLLFKPLLGLVMQLFLGIRGGSGALFNDQILSFALSVPGVLAALLLIGLATLFIYFEFSVVITLARQAAEGEAPALMRAMAGALWAFGSLRGPGMLLFAMYSLLLLPVVNMGVTSSLLPALAIPNFITGELTKTPVGQWLLMGAGALVAVVFFCLLFTLPAMVLERVHFGRSVKRSLAAIRAYGLRMVGVVLVFAAAWGLLFGLPRLAFGFFFGRPSATFLEALTTFGFSLRTPVVVVVWLAATAAQLR